MKILVVTDRLGKEQKTGSDIFCDSLLQELRKRHTVVAIGRTYAPIQGCQVAENGDIIVDDAAANDSRILMRFVREHLKPAEFDLLYNLGGLVFNSKVVNLIRMLTPKIPVVNHFQALLVEYVKTENLNELLQLQAREQQVSCVRGSALNIFLSLAEYRTAMRHKFPVETRPAAIVPNAVRAESFEGIVPDDSYLPDSLRQGKRPTILFTAGGFGDRTKGGDLVYRMFLELLRQEENVFLLAVTDSDRYAYLLRDAPEERYKILNWMPRREFLAKMAASDIVIVPSRYEAFGLVAVEGMMLGKPVVANSVGGLEEVVSHEITGLLNEPRAGSWGLAQAVHRLLRAPEFARCLGEEGKRVAGTQFLLERSAQLVERELHRALNHHRATSNITDIGVALL